MLVSGYLTNVSIISHLLGPNDLLIMDELSHNSIVAGAKATKATVLKFRHNDFDDLQFLLRRNRECFRNSLIVTEGLATLSSAVMAKRLELLNEIAPHSRVFAALINPKNPYAAITTKEAQDAARALGKDIHIVHASSESELNSVFVTPSQAKMEGLLIAPDGLFIIRAAQVAALSVKHAIPASHERRAFPDAGGLMSYGASQADGMRLAGVYTGRVLKGEKPADMPVIQPTKFELVINHQTARMLGLSGTADLLLLPSPTR